MNTQEMLKSATIQSQGHTGTLQNFDPLEDESQGKSYRIEVDWRTIISAIIFFGLVAVASTYFAYNAGAATTTDQQEATTSETALKRSAQEVQEPVAPPVCPEVPLTAPDSAIDVLGRVNLNKATADDLQTLSGVGPATAERIISYRAEHGKFNRIEDLMEVKGIGQATFDKLKDKLTVG